MFVDWLCCQHRVDEPELQLPTLPQSDDEVFRITLNRIGGDGMVKQLGEKNIFVHCD